MRLLPIFLFLLACLFYLPLAEAAEVPAKNQAQRAPVVRTINITVADIFDEPDIGVFYRTVNKLKTNTREDVVRRELVIAEGDVFQPFLIEESIRNLRRLSFLRKVSITPVFDADHVDLFVQVQDTWTLFPIIVLPSGGGVSKKAIGLVEGNILGYGKRVELLVADDEGREKIEAVWDDQRLLGTQHQLTLGHFQRSDGHRSIFTVGRPFRSLVDPSAWSINGEFFDLVGRLFEGGDERFIYREKTTSIASGYTIARGDPETRLRRYTLGYDYTKDEFTEADDGDFEDIDLDPSSVSRDPALLADDRKYSGPTFSLQQIEQDYLSINYVDRFERVEDFNLGHELNLSVHVAPKVLDSLRDTLRLRLSDSRGSRLSEKSFLRGEAGSSLRIDDNGASSIVIKGELKYYNVLGPVQVGDFYLGRHTLAAAFSIDSGEKLDRDFEVLLGAGRGLRGYEDRAFSGDHLLLLNLEDRFFLAEDVYRLVNIGGVFFVDIGGTSRKNPGSIIENGLYTDFGIGLRLGFPRSSGGAVMRVDLAFPLRDGPDGSLAMEPRLLITTGQAFGAGLPSEVLRNQAAAVSAGFLP